MGFLPPAKGSGCAAQACLLPLQLSQLHRTTLKARGGLAHALVSYHQLQLLHAHVNPLPRTPPALHGEDVPYSRSPPPHSHTLIQVTVGKRVCWQIKEEVGRLKSSVLYLLVRGFFLMQLVLFVHLFPPGAPACIMLLIHLLSLSGAHRISEEVVTQVLAVNLASPGGWEPPSPP